MTTDERMYNSIEIELLTLADAYEFDLECPLKEDERREIIKSIAFKHKQIAWLKDLYKRVTGKSID